MRDDNCSRDHSQHAKHHVHETQSSIPCTSIARKRKKLQCPSIAIAYKERYDRPSNGYQDEERAADCQKSGLHLEAKAPGPKGSGTRGPDRHIRSPCSFTRRTAPSLDVSASAVPRSRRSLYHLAKLLSGCAPTMKIARTRVPPLEIGTRCGGDGCMPNIGLLDLDVARTA